MSGTFECKAVGFLKSNSSLTQVSEILFPLCYSYEPNTIITEVILNASVNNTSTIIKLQNFKISTPKDSIGEYLRQDVTAPIWSLRHEGVTLKGKDYNDLPAAIAEVTETFCHGEHTIEFWKSFGAVEEHRTIRTGDWYEIHYEGFDIKVIVSKLESIPADSGSGTPGTRETQGDFEGIDSIRIPFSQGLLVEASCRAANGRQIMGARTLGKFSALIADCVSLHPFIY